MTKSSKRIAISQCLLQIGLIAILGWQFPTQAKQTDQIHMGFLSESVLRQRLSQWFEVPEHSLDSLELYRTAEQMLNPVNTVLRTLIGLGHPYVLKFRVKIGPQETPYHFVCELRRDDDRQLIWIKSETCKTTQSTHLNDLFHLPNAQPASVVLPKIAETQFEFPYSEMTAINYKIEEEPSPQAKGASKESLTRVAISEAKVEELELQSPAISDSELGLPWDSDDRFATELRKGPIPDDQSLRILGEFYLVPLESILLESFTKEHQSGGMDYYMFSPTGKPEDTLFTNYNERFEGLMGVNDFCGIQTSGYDENISKEFFMAKDSKIEVKDRDFLRMGYHRSDSSNGGGGYPREYLYLGNEQMRFDCFKSKSGSRYHFGNGKGLESTTVDFTAGDLKEITGGLFTAHYKPDIPVYANQNPIKLEIPGTNLKVIFWNPNVRRGDIIYIDFITLHPMSTSLMGIRPVNVDLRFQPADIRGSYTKRPYTYADRILPNAIRFEIDSNILGAGRHKISSSNLLTKQLYRMSPSDALIAFDQLGEAGAILQITNE